MLSREENDLITQTGPGTPGGDLFRRYWQPIGLSEELPEGGEPVSIKILSEELALFRDDTGKPGLMGLHCPHRAADLSYGRCEDGGLRCLYHGWLFDTAGNCIEQPGEPEGSGFKDKVKNTAYHCVEKVGIIFAYMGPGEAPLLPAFDFLNVPESHVYVTKYFNESNYLQANEGNIDPQHLSYLHKFVKDDPNRPSVAGSSTSSNAFFGQDVAPQIEVEETNYGIRIFSVRTPSEEEKYVRITNFIFPNASLFGGVHYHVPIDDTHHWKFRITFDVAEPVDKERMQAEDAKEIGPDYRHRRTEENRFMQDRSEMKNKSFIGMGPNFQVHDLWATNSEGPIQDRTKEQLGYTDKAITAARRQLLAAIRDMQEGNEPPYILRDPDENHFQHLLAINEVVPSSVDWMNLWKERMTS
jgi:phenylpropionate dioxygenase-like ring-hydroxylating dioxygenase large terminal subunit